MEDTIKLPLDADGVPIRPGDVVYIDGEDSENEVRAINFARSSYRPWLIELDQSGRVFDPKKRYRFPHEITHTKPDTWKVIERAVFEFAHKATIACKSKEEIKEEVAPLMERIKRMVER